LTDAAAQPDPLAHWGGPMLVTAPQMCRLLQVSKNEVMRLHAEGLIPEPVIHKRGCLRWHIEDLRAWRLGAKGRSAVVSQRRA